jgi:DNA-directed RNA polymerase specialized sigma subunit
MSTEPTPSLPPKIQYLNNKELLIAIGESKAQGKMNDKLARMIQLLCAKYAAKGNFVNYTYNSDMQAYAMMMLVRTWNSFDPNKSNNPFAFFTQCIKNSFIQYLNKEKRQRIVRDLLLVKQGMNPSFGFTEDASDQHFVEDEQDYYHYRETAIELQQQLQQDSFVDEFDISVIEELEELEELDEIEVEEYQPILK